MRIGGLALMWLPALLLLSAALAPSEQAELFLIAGGSFALALATDRLLPWPRGPAVPALVALLAYTVDLANHSHLVIRSLLGPSPRSGSRFYGLGNELEIALTIVLLVGARRGRCAIAGARAATRSRSRSAGSCSRRSSAPAGSAPTSAGSSRSPAAPPSRRCCCCRAASRKRAIALAILAPLAGLAALAALDLATGGNGHFTRTVLHGNASDQLNTFQRRYELAWSIVSHGYAPLLTILCALAVAYALVHRDRVYATIRGDAVWRAAPRRRPRRLDRRQPLQRLRPAAALHRHRRAHVRDGVPAESPERAGARSEGHRGEGAAALGRGARTPIGRVARVRRFPRPRPRIVCAGDRTRPQPRRGPAAVSTRPSRAVLGITVSSSLGYLLPALVGARVDGDPVARRDGARARLRDGKPGQAADRAGAADRRRLRDRRRQRRLLDRPQGGPAAC